MCIYYLLVVDCCFMHVACVNLLRWRLVGWNGLEWNGMESIPYVWLAKIQWNGHSIGMVIPPFWWNGHSIQKPMECPFHSNVKYLFHKSPHMHKLHFKNTLLSKNNILSLYIILMIYKYIL